MILYNNNNNNNNNSLCIHLNNCRKNSLKCYQIIMLNKIIIINDVSSVFCGIFKCKAQFLSPEVACSTSRHRIF